MIFITDHLQQTIIHIPALMQEPGGSALASVHEVTRLVLIIMYFNSAAE